MNLRRTLRNCQFADLVRHRYFMVGLCLQKGMPLLIMPITLSVIGATTYSQYVLLYTLVQVIGVVGSLCLAQSIMPFWYENDDKESLLGSFLLAMAAVEVVLSAPIALLLYAHWSRTHLEAGRVLGVVSILVYAICYSLNALALNLVRLRLKQLAFVMTTAITSAVLVALIFALKYVPGPKLLLFTGINIVVLILQTALYFWYSGVYPRKILSGPEFKNLARNVFRYSWPLTIYTLVTLCASTADKWIVRSAFPGNVFSQYVLDFQFSFALTFLCVVIGMYNSQKLCELVHLDDVAELRRNLIGNYLLSAAGSIGLAVAVFVYAHIGRIRLSHGFWILAVAFAISNCYGVNSNLLSAQKRSRRLAVIGAAATALFISMLLTLLVWKFIVVLYVAYLAYYSVMFSVSSGYVWKGLSRTEPSVKCRLPLVREPELAGITEVRP